MNEKIKFKKVGILRGRFDLIHCGHIELFELAKEFVDELHILIDSKQYAERSGKKLIHDDEERMEQIISIRWVDGVHLFYNEKDFRDICENIRFANTNTNFYYFKGGDYSPTSLEEAGPLREMGFKIICLDYNEKYSTTKLKHKIYHTVVDEMKVDLQKIDEVSKKIKEKLDSSDVHYIQLPLSFFGEDK